MANVAIYKKGTDEIIYFVIDCVQSDGNFIGSNKRLSGVKKFLFDFLWTLDVATYDQETKTWDKKVSELVETEAGSQVVRPTHAQMETAIKIRNKIVSLNYSSIDQRIDEIETIDDVKVFLKILSKTAKAQMIISDRNK